MASIDLLPALDLWDGAIMHANAEDSITPYDLLEQWKSEGAQWVHLVDMNRAFGQGDNSELISELIKNTSLRVELAGGLTSIETVEQGLEAGATRVNIASQALGKIEKVKEMIKEFEQKVAVCLDINNGNIVPRGIGEDLGPLHEFLGKLEDSGPTRYVVTDVTKDGSLQGPNLELIQKITEYTENPIIASGGVSELADIEALKKYESSGVEGIILGKALHCHKFSLSQALEVGKT